MLKVERSEADVGTRRYYPSFDALAQELLAAGLCLRCKVRGQSMYPFIQNGDIVLIEPKGRARVNTGDIIFFRRPWGTYVVHRLVKKNGSATLITKGDNSHHYDEPVPVERVLGRVIQIEGRGRQASLRGGLSRIIGLISAWLARGRGSTRTRLRRNLGRLWWLIEGRRTR